MNRLKDDAVALAGAYLNDDHDALRVALAEIGPDAHTLHHVCLMLAEMVNRPEKNL